MRCCVQRFLCRARCGQFVYAENQGEGEGEVVGWMERCAYRGQSFLPLLHGRGGVVVGRRGVLPISSVASTIFNIKVGECCVIYLAIK